MAPPVAAIQGQPAEIVWDPDIAKLNARDTADAKVDKVADVAKASLNNATDKALESSAKKVGLDGCADESLKPVAHATVEESLNLTSAGIKAGVVHPVTDASVDVVDSSVRALSSQRG